MKGKITFSPFLVLPNFNKVFEVEKLPLWWEFELSSYKVEGQWSISMRN